MWGMDYKMSWTLTSYPKDDDDCCTCHLATMQLVLPNVDEDDIIYLSLKNNFLQTPFMIVADRKLEKIVISIRGSWSVTDMLTDMVASPVGLKSMLLENFHENNGLELSAAELTNLEQLSDDIKVHAGMAEAAIYVFKKIKEKHLLEQAKVHFPEYSIVVTGHSLGAGTAVILGFFLRLNYSNVKCYAFGPPGGLLNSPASTMSKQFVISIAVGDDIVPRLSVNSLLSLRSDMKKSLITCQLPKHKVLATGFCNCLSPETWKDRLKNDPAVSSSNNPDLEQFNNYGTVEDDDVGFENQTEMLPPGQIIHLKEQNETLSMCFREPKEFREIVISTKMINDHAPSSYQKMLTKVITKFVSRNSIEV